MRVSLPCTLLSVLHFIAFEDDGVVLFPFFSATSLVRNWQPTHKQMHIHALLGVHSRSGPCVGSPWVVPSLDLGRLVCQLNLRISSPHAVEVRPWGVSKVDIVPLATCHHQRDSCDLEIVCRRAGVTAWFYATNHTREQFTYVE